MNDNVVITMHQRRYGIDQAFSVTRFNADVIQKRGANFKNKIRFVVILWFI